MDYTPSLNAKGFFRFTGPPENWLTAIKYMTWGLEEKFRTRWQEIETGDIFFIHSTGTQTSLFPNAKSGIIGIGVVGSNFTVKDSPLWIKEIKERRNIWPLLIPLSEVYLFSEIPPREKWNAPTLTNAIKVKPLIDSILKNYIPLATIRGFPQMGSFSSVSREVAQQILDDKRPLFLHRSDVEEDIRTAKPTKLESINSASEALRYADTLKVFNSIQKRVVKEASIQYVKDSEFLARAEDAHSTILEQLIEIFRSRGYETRSNRFVDLFAYNEQRSFLFEVKSTENTNFRSQARKGLIQLFEYDYFEIRKFTADNNLNFQEKYKILTPSQVPKDDRYVDFINNLKTGVAMVEGKSLKAVGTDFGFTKL